MPGLRFLWDHHTHCSSPSWSYLQSSLPIACVPEDFTDIPAYLACCMPVMVTLFSLLVSPNTRQRGLVFTAQARHCRTAFNHCCLITDSLSTTALQYFYCHVKVQFLLVVFSWVKIFSMENTCSFGKSYEKFTVFFHKGMVQQLQSRRPFVLISALKVSQINI